MAIIQYKNVGISAIAACVPKNISSNYNLKSLLSSEEIEKTINSIGIKVKRFVDSDVCSSDLCVKAAEKLFEDNTFDKNEIDVLIFLSQTPDYRQPATSMSIQYRLGLPKTTACFDVNLACSGYVYGLSIAYSYAMQEGVRKVLLLVGETMSKTISSKDKVTFPLFGDAGTATLIEKNNNSTTSYFSLNSNGEDSKILNMPYGGYRNMSSIEGFIEKEDEDGNIRHGEHLKMDGMDVFNFGISVVPSDIKKVLKYSNKEIIDVDILVYHQANKLMTDFFSKRLKISHERVLYSLEKYGNTSSASIPLTFVECLGGRDVNFHNVIISGFGAGLSWGTALLALKDTNISKLIEY